MNEAVVADRLTLALGRREVLSDVSFTVPAGAFVGLLGPNGSGKTTLLRAILGLVPPAAGHLRVFGKHAARGVSAIGYMPQHRSATGLALRGWEFLASSVDGHRWGLPLPRRGARRDIQRALALVEAEDLADRRLGSLSGGERQRLLLAQALLGAPRLLLLDEPLISLDPPHQTAVVQTVRRLQQAAGLTVLFSAHELNPLLPAIDQVLYLGNGRAALGPVEQVITGPVLSRLYGAEVEVVRVGGRVFVMAGGHDLEGGDAHHRHEHV